MQYQLSHRLCKTHYMTTYNRWENCHFLKSFHRTYRVSAYREINVCKHIAHPFNYGLHLNLTTWSLATYHLCILWEANGNTIPYASMSLFPAYTKQYTLHQILYQECTWHRFNEFSLDARSKNAIWLHISSTNIDQIKGGVGGGRRSVVTLQVEAHLSITAKLKVNVL